jgi:site-specific recombinase XerC
VFPYARLAFVRLEQENDHDTLHVCLDTHEIQIIGKNLHEVELALQKFAVEWVRESPARYNPQANEDEVWIAGITVNELQV